MTNKNPTIGTLPCVECGATVTVRLMKEGKGRAYYRCNAKTEPGQCGTWVTFGPAKTETLKAASADQTEPTPEPITEDPTNEPAAGLEPSNSDARNDSDGNFLTDW